MLFVFNEIFFYNYPFYTEGYFRVYVDINNIAVFEGR